MDDAWKAVADRVRARRKELTLTQEQLAAKAEVAVSTVRVLEGAGREGYQASTLSALSRALGWPSGGIDAIRRGKEPDEVEARAYTRDDRTVEERLSDLEAGLTKVLGLLDQLVGRAGQRSG